MNKLLTGMTLLLLCGFAAAEPYKSIVKFSEGEVVSAAVLNDLIDRIELSLKEVTVDEILGSWTATQYSCWSSLNDPTLDATQAGSRTCNYNLGLTGVANAEGNLAVKRTDTVMISAVSGQDNQFDIAFSTRNMFGNDSSGTIQTAANFNSAKTHRCAFLGDAALFGCLLDPSMKEPGRRFSSYFNTQRLSSTRIKLSWGPWRGGGLFNVVILDKDKLPPDAPTSVQTTLSSSAVAVSWTASTDATSYDVQRKTTASGTFASIGTSTTASYSDTSVASGRNYWYRIFAKNTNGTSVGSSVVKVTFNPAANLSASNIEIIDFFNGDDSKKAEHKIYYTTTNNVMNANLSVGKLDKENLNGLLAGSNGKSPIIKFGLSSFPSAGMSGTATLSTKLIDGNDSSIDAGERVIAANADISWLSDGEKLVLTVPNQSSNVSLNDGDGTTLISNWAIGGSSDLMTISSTGLNKPVTLDIKLLEFLSSNIAANGPSIGNFFSEGAYFFEMGISGIDLIDSSGNSFNKVQGTFGVDSNPLSIAYIDDVKVQENTGTATVIVSLSSPSINEVKLDYSTSESSATNGQDFTSTSGSLRIAAGDVKGAFTIPLIDDAISENNEIFNISFSNILNAELGRSTSSITIIDNDTST